jgi:hypothetical protein
VFGTGSAFAAAGAGDPTFGQGGKIIISLPDNNVIANDAVLQLDGKIVVAAVLMPTVATLNQFATAPFGVFASSVACEAGRRDVDIAAGLLSAEGQSRPEVQQPGL